MAATNGKMNLITKLTTIANIVRDKMTPMTFAYSDGVEITPNTTKYTLTDIINILNTKWYNYVKQVYVKGSFDKVDTSFGLQVSYTQDGIVLLTAKSYTDSGEYEHIKWKLRNAPNGVSIIIGNDPKDQTNGERGQLISCLLLGISQNCKLTIEQTDTSSTHDYTEISIDVTYI